MKYKKDYVDLHSITEQERDSIEHEVTVFVKSCKEQIDVLKNSINEEDAHSKGWLGFKGDNLNADTIAHKHGVFDQLRAIRFQDAINRVTPRRKRKNSTKSNATETSVSSSFDPDMKRDSEIRDSDISQAAPIRVQEQLLVRSRLVGSLLLEDLVPENNQHVEAKITIYFHVLLPTMITHMMQVELNSLLDSVQETETKMVEMSALNHLMSTHVLQQAQQIELLYEQISNIVAILVSSWIEFLFC
ncbi:syntaxin-81-like isoform X2 [Nicotiana tabacum]|uniref:Syntaxin-81-like isoform X2 n=1 Tax=Nicotiana tabacum TaxID=4097 RepID=A0AC58TNB2_TOBAC